MLRQGRTICVQVPTTGLKGQRESVTEPSPCVSRGACSQERPQTLSSSSCRMHEALGGVLGPPACPCATTHAHMEPGGKRSRASVPT